MKKAKSALRDDTYLGVEWRYFPLDFVQILHLHSVSLREEINSPSFQKLVVFGLLVVFINRSDSHRRKHHYSVYAVRDLLFGILLEVLVGLKVVASALLFLYHAEVGVELIHLSRD